jgi:serine-type D-Ala-D-Ala carboxypeptidase/endopeptidase
MTLQIEEYLRLLRAAAIGALSGNRPAALPPSRETKPRRRALLKIALAAILIPSVSVQAALLPERIAKAAQDYVDAGEYPALVIAYVDGDKSEIEAFGKLDNGSGPDANTVFEIGSITKTFTATLLALDVQSGKRKLDQPVAELLPGFKVPSRNGKSITLLDLADQHSGLPRLPSNLAPDAANPYATYDATKLKSFLSSYVLTRDPGETYEYSNLGFGLLGFALAREAHMDYGGLLQQKILQPLDMTMSGATLNANMRAHLALGHAQNGEQTGNWDFDALAGCGAMRSNADDMLRYLKANMGLTKTPLAAAMKLAQQPRRDVGKDQRIGLAWMTHAAKTGDVVWHNGGTGGYRSFIGWRADGRRGVVILTNIQTSVDELGFAALLDEAPLAPATKSISLDVAALDDYVGVYKLADNFLITITRADTQLLAQATGQGPFPIFPSAANEFFARVADIRISFSRDAQSRVGGMVLHQNGDHSASKLSAAQIAAATKSIQLDLPVLRDYVGHYQLAPGAIFAFTLKDEQLYAQLTGQPALPVLASAKDQFFYTAVDAQLIFERNAGGEITAVTLHQNGQNQRAARIKP